MALRYSVWRTCEEMLPLKQVRFQLADLNRGFLSLMEPGDQEKDRLPASLNQYWGLVAPPGFLVSILRGCRQA